MPTGTIKFFNSQKGFGFIVADEGSKEVFLPKATLGTTDTARLKPGQRVSFEVETEARGLKAVSLTLLERAPPPPAPSPPPQQPQQQAALAIFHDPASEESEEVLDELRSPDRALREVDVTTAPPTPQDLRKWSLLLGGSGRGLVRRFHPMFHALQLDDRFIGQDEFWTAVSEHPVLIETPLLVWKDRVAVCKSADDVRAFLSRAAAALPPKAKGLSPRLAAMIRGEEVPPPPPEPEKPVVVAAPVQEEAVTEEPVTIKPAAAAPKPKADKPKAAAPKKAAAVTKAKPPAKKAAPAAKPKKPTGRR